MKKLILLIMIGILGFGASIDITAQTKNSEYSYHNSRRKMRQHKSKHIAQHTVKLEKPAVLENQKVAENPVFPIVPIVPVAYQEMLQPPKSRVEKMKDETLGGNMVVDVSANGNTVIKIGLADRAVSLIDFPANDPVYKIHPGNENFVTVGCFGREANGKCLNSPTDAIVLRPGKDFHSLGDEDSAATVITIQRVSGIVVTLLVVPVKRISENTNYVAVRYVLDNVLKTRRESGLATNLNDSPAMSVQTPVTQQTAPVMAATGGTTQIVDASLNTSIETDAANNADENAPALSLEQTLLDEIQRVAKSGAAMKFSKPVYGLSLARASTYSSRVKDITIEVIAVRNTYSSPVRLVPDQPTMAVENRDSKQTSINLKAVDILSIATTVESDDVLEAGRIQYFAFAYRSPILDVKQNLIVSFAQREAADVPASIILSGVNR